METMQCQPNLLEVEQTLSKHAYFSRSPLPGFADGVIYSDEKEYPDKKIHPNFYHWYVVMRQFANTSIEGWIREKRYIDNQSEKCLMLIADTFTKHSLRVLHSSNRNQTLNANHEHVKSSSSLLMQSAKLKPIEMNNFINLPLEKAEYRMVVQLRHVQSMENLFQRFYKLKYLYQQTRIKLKELKFHNKHEKSIFLRFVTQKNNFEAIQDEINDWIQVRRVVIKQSIDLDQVQEDKTNQRFASIR